MMKDSQRSMEYCLLNTDRCMMDAKVCQLAGKQKHIHSSVGPRGGRCYEASHDAPASGIAPHAVVVDGARLQARHESVIPDAGIKPALSLCGFRAHFSWGDQRQTGGIRILSTRYRSSEINYSVACCARCITRDAVACVTIFIL